MERSGERGDMKGEERGEERRDRRVGVRRGAKRGVRRWMISGVKRRFGALTCPILTLAGMRMCNN